LRVTKFDQLRKFYANNRKGDVYLQDILLSKNNAIDYQWNQFVKRKDTEIAIKAIDEMYTIKKLYSSDFKVAAYANLLKPLIDAYNGDVSKVKRDVKKIYYPDATKISDTIADTIVDLCATYKKTKMSKKNGSMFVNKLADNFKELEKQIKEI
jgi:hypothetical protein